MGVKIVRGWVEAIFRGREVFVGFFLSCAFQKILYGGDTFEKVGVYNLLRDIGKARIMRLN